MSHKLVLVRHGQSTWNEENRFTGWTDVDLSALGREEAKRAGELIKDAGLTFDIAYTSVLKRAIRTLWIILDQLDLMWLPVLNSWRLNERHYGALQGLNKTETAAKFGDEQVHIWRRSYDVPPPSLEKGSSDTAGSACYADLGADGTPLTECLKDTVARFMPYWDEHISKSIKAGKKVLVVAHGNTIRALIKYLDNVSDADIVNLNIPTGVPLVYELDEDLKPIKHYYLGDPADIERAAQAVANQGKAPAA